MAPALICACLWGLGASLCGLAPQRFHWPAAWALIAIGIPLLGWVTFSAGPVWGMVCLLGGASVLRWPLRRLVRRLRAAIASAVGVAGWSRPD